MALLIEKQTQIYNDIDVSSLYVRFRLDYDIQGDSVYVFSKVFSSKSSYLADHNVPGIQIAGIPSILEIEYDRSTDGYDLLTVAHNKFKDYLSTDIIESVPVLDPSTGEQTYDPSTGDLITEEVISVPKFAMDSSISIVDVSIG